MFDYILINRARAGLTSKNHYIPPCGRKKAKVFLLLPEGEKNTA